MVRDKIEWVKVLRVRVGVVVGDRREVSVVWKGVLNN